MNDHIRTIKNIQIVFIVLLVLAIIGFVVMLFAGELDVNSGITTAVSIILLSLFIRLITAITDAIEASYLKAVASRPSENHQSFMQNSSKKLSPGAKSSAWRDLNEENR